ncbi:MAG: helix-turn-helix transcriptional regulator [Pyrinomonadaceae bacterium]
MPRPVTNARLTFAVNMRNFRLERGLSQEQLAELANLHRTYVGSVERGERNITIDNIEKIAIALQVSVTALLEENAK